MYIDVSGYDNAHQAGERATTRHGHSMQGGATTPGEQKKAQSGA